MALKFFQKPVINGLLPVHYEFFGVKNGKVSVCDRSLPIFDDYLGVKYDKVGLADAFLTVGDEIFVVGDDDFNAKNQKIKI